jgi:hypothetical protein
MNRILSFAFLIPILFVACTDSTSTEKGTLRVSLTDSPATYDAVYVDIQRVEVNRTTDAGESGWINVMDQPVRLNLLSLVNGVDSLLGEIELSPGMYRQIRLILGPDNDIVVNGTSYPLSTPSAEQTGLKLSMNAQIESGVTYDLLLDFDAAKSIVRRGAPQGPATYLLKPVIRMITSATSGAISGVVSPISAASNVYVIAGTDTMTTYADSLSGGFLIRGVPSGTHTVTFLSKNPAYRDSTRTGVSVSTGSNTNLGTITLRAN